jgi:superfamily II DNA or RNA helicase
MLELAGRKFHFVAPPGSGKTLIGLELVRRLGNKAVVFSPNQAIQEQWITRLCEVTDDLSISTEPDGGADILSLTYQLVSVKAPGSGKLHRNAQDLIRKLSERKTVILDECHHLTAWWARIIKLLVSGGAFVVGLTATPTISPIL